MDKAKAIELLRQGYGGKPIAKALGVRVCQLAGYLKNDAELVRARHQGRSVLVAMREEGLRLHEIAKRTGWSVTALSLTLQDAGLGRTKCADRRLREVNYWIRRKWA